MNDPAKLYQLADRLDAAGRCARAKQVRKEAMNIQTEMRKSLRNRTKAIAAANFGQTVGQFFLAVDKDRLGREHLAKSGR